MILNNKYTLHFCEDLTDSPEVFIIGLEYFHNQTDDENMVRVTITDGEKPIFKNSVEYYNVNDKERNKIYTDNLLAERLIELFTFYFDTIRTPGTSFVKLNRVNKDGVIVYHLHILFKEEDGTIISRHFTTMEPTNYINIF